MLRMLFSWVTNVWAIPEENIEGSSVYVRRNKFIQTDYEIVRLLKSTSRNVGECGGKVSVKCRTGRWRSSVRCLQVSKFGAPHAEGIIQVLKELKGCN
jgi:hypothetical protein